MSKTPRPGLRRLLSALFGAAGQGRTVTGTVEAPAVGTPGGPVPTTYLPEADGEPDPGEVVWAWVPYEEDATRGKDRPVLLLGEQDGTWTALMMSSQDHDLDAEDEARHGRYWMDVGSGAWDASGRPSEVRLDRLLRLDRASIRREGAALEASLFAAVAAAVREHHP